MTTQLPTQVARITWPRASGETTTETAMRGRYDTGVEVWLTATRFVGIDRVTKVERLVTVDLADVDALGQIVDDATRNAGELTVSALTYALREHRLRTEEEN